MVVFVLKDAREPASGAHLDGIAVHVVAAQDCAERAAQRVAVAGDGQAALGFAHHVGFGGQDGSRPLGVPHEAERGVDDDAAQGRIEAARGSLIELEDVAVAGVEGASTAVPPYEDLGADAHLGRGEADAGCRVHCVDHVGDEVAQLRIEGLDRGCGPVQNRLAGNTDRQDAHA